MARIGEICHHVRSKNAGPFWVTVDLFFRDMETFERYADSPALGPDLFARLFDTDPALVKRIPVRSLCMMKVSYARPKPQGWMGERDMHQGQSFARLLDVEVG